MADSMALPDFDALLQNQPKSELDALLNEEPAATPAAESGETKGKARLNRENQELHATVVRMQRLVKGLFMALGALAFLAVGLVFYARGAKARALRQAFEILHYREKRTLQANAIVLNEYAEGLKQIQNEVKVLPGISEEERELRQKAMGSTANQADTLEEGFVNLLKSNDRERGKGSTFEYRDPFLKRPIDFDNEMGGEISLEKLRDEVKAAAKMDEAMKELRAVMLSPVPIADQMKVEARRQDAPLVNEKGQEIPRQQQAQPSFQFPGGPQPLRLPGVGGVAPGGSPQ